MDDRATLNGILYVLHADKGYDYRRCRDACVQRGIKHRIARKGIESKTHLGRHRWVVEGTLAWTARFRRLAVRYDCAPRLSASVCSQAWAGCSWPPAARARQAATH